MTPHSSQIRTAAVFGALAVALGAFGAHGLADLLTKNGTLEIWKTASHYHLVHAVLLLVLGFVGERTRKSAFCIAAGTVIFSGSLYVLAVTNIKWLGAITPIGGVLLIVGWLLLALRRW